MRFEADGVDGSSEAFRFVSSFITAILIDRTRRRADGRYDFPCAAIDESNITHHPVQNTSRRRLASVFSVE